MMEFILFGILVLLLSAGVLLVLRDLYVKRKLRKLLAKKYNAVKPLMKRISANENVNREEIRTMASDPSLRLAVFWILHAYGKVDLFPEEYFTHEKGAESFLVNWLEFPTELGAAPDNIEFLTKVTLNDKEPFDYYVFKFNVRAPQWSTEEWMIGTCGPYGQQTLPYAVPPRVFSRFNPLGSITPESEVQWVHENVSKKKTLKNLRQNALLY